MCGIQSRLVFHIGPLERTLWVRSSALVCVDRWRGHSRCRAPLTTGVDIYPTVLPSALYVTVTHITVCLWRGHSHCRAPLTTGVEFYHRVLPYKITIRSSALVCVDRWLGHSRCWVPLTTGVDIYPRVLPSAYCVLVAGPLPLQGALNHWGRILPPGSTIQNNNQLRKRVCKNTRF